VRLAFQVLPVLLLAGLASPAAAQIDPKTALLERAGFDALQVGDARRAADAFREALAADPGNAVLHFGAGVAAYLEQRDQDARVAFERALALNPELSDAREFLARALYRLGDLSGAVRVYEAVVAGARGGPEAEATLGRWRRELELHDRMLHAIGNHFTVSFEGPAEEALATRALESLDRAYWRIGGLLQTYPADPISVVLYTSAQFQDITRSPQWAAGAYDGTIRVPMRGALSKGAELDRVLAHEVMHAVVHSLAPRGVPTWLGEGLAAAYETDNLTWAVVRLLEAGRALPLASLAGSFGRLTGSDAEVAYASSAIAVGRLIDEAGGAAVANLLRDLGEGADFETAFSRRMQRPFASFVASLETPNR